MLSWCVSYSSQIAWTAKITVFISDSDMVEIGNGASIEGHLLARRFDPSCMILQRLKIGNGVSVGAGAVVYGATQIGDHRYCPMLCVSVVFREVFETDATAYLCVIHDGTNPHHSY